MNDKQIPTYIEIDIVGKYYILPNPLSVINLEELYALSHHFKLAFGRLYFAINVHIFSIFYEINPFFG